jgi:hypothetical protein
MLLGEHDDLNHCIDRRRLLYPTALHSSLQSVAERSVPRGRKRTRQGRYRRRAKNQRLLCRQCVPVMPMTPGESQSFRAEVTVVNSCFVGSKSSSVRPKICAVLCDITCHACPPKLVHSAAIGIRLPCRAARAKPGCSRIAPFVF